MTGTRSALLAVSLVVAGAAGAVLLHAPVQLIYLGIALTLGGICVAIGSTSREHTAHTCGCQQELEWARQNLANVTALHLASIQERAACPWCRERLGPSIDDSLSTIPPGDAA